jgi:hypothetical protein
MAHITIISSSQCEHADRGKTTAESAIIMVQKSPDTDGTSLSPEIMNARYKIQLAINYINRMLLSTARTLAQLHHQGKRPLTVHCGVREFRNSEAGRSSFVSVRVDTHRCCT